MEKRKKLLYNSIIATLLLILLYAIVKLFPVYKVIFIFIVKLVSPFLIAAFISYLIQPLIVKMDQWKLKKSVSIMLFFLIFVFLTLVISYKSIPTFIYELQELSEQLPQLIQLYEGMILNVYESTSFLPETVHDKMDTFISGIEEKLNHKISLLLEGILNIPDIIVFIAIIPVLVFYYLKDYPLIFKWLKGLLPRKYHQRFDRFLKAIDESLGDYIRGQLIISSVIIAITYLIYHLMDLKYALLLAIFMGLMNIIPYFGPIIGSVPAVAIALTMDVKYVLVVIGANALVQLLESSFLSPYIMGKSVQIHPILLIFTLLVGAEIGGIVGMIVAVPSVTIFRAVFLQYQLEKQHSH